MTTFASPTLATTYQGLCAAIEDTLNRQDLATAIPNFVTLATSRIQRDISRARHPMAISRAQSSVTNNYAPLPGDYLSVYQLMDQNTQSPLHYISPDQSKDVLANGWSVPGQYAYGETAPSYYTIIGDTLRIIPAPGTTSPASLDLWYYATLAPLSTTSTTNWVLTRYPDLYLYGSLVHSAPYLKNDERIALWDGIYNRILGDIEIEADRAIRPQSKLVAARRSF